MARHPELKDLIIRTLKSPEKGVNQYPDGKSPGFGVRVTSNGVKSFYLRCRINGQHLRLNLGRYPDTSLSAARDLAAQARVLARRGIDPRVALKLGTTIDSASSSCEHLFQNALQEYLDRYCTPYNKASTVAEKRRLLHSVFESKWRNRYVTTLKKTDILAVTDAILARGKESAARHAFKEIQTFFSWCVGRDYLTVSPCAGVQPPAPARSRERVLSDDEIRAIWEASAGLGRFGSIARLCLLTGQRRSEVSGMLWSELDGEQRLWSMPGHRTKNGRPHTVPLAPQVVAQIEKIAPVKLPFVEGGYNQTLQFSDCVFPSRSDPRQPYSGFSKGKQTLDRLSGVRNWGLHDLRRTVASRMAELGTQPHVIEKVLNHAGGSFAGVAGVYNRHEYLEEKAEALQLWANRVFSILEKPSMKLFDSSFEGSPSPMPPVL